jgi:glycosyltransferase involved in cell wall biosynthesis
LQRKSRKMKTVLFYYHPNKRSIATETLCNEICKTGNRLIVLTQTPRGDLHKQLDVLKIENHVKVYNSRISGINYFFHFLYLIRFCLNNKIDVVWSHLNPCNFVAVFAQYFIKARTVIFRHHFHASIKTEGFASVNKNELKIDRIINKLAKEMVVPSNEVYNGMTIYEKVRKEKIEIIPYIYNFDQYSKPDAVRVKALREKYNARLLIITASRMIKMKRHDLVMPVYKELIQEGYDIKVLLMDEGEEKSRLEEFVLANKLQDNIFFQGFQRSIIDYLASSDLLVHPSYTEASSSLVKEFGLMKKPVIVCSGVGDFDQYIVNDENGFLVPPDDEATVFKERIIYIYSHPEEAKRMGESLYTKIIHTFSANKNTIAKYLIKI